MLTKEVLWAGIKNTKGGEAAIRAGLDPTDESDAFEHTFKTMLGPLQLLQVGRIREAEGHRPTDEEHAEQHEPNKPSIPQRRVVTPKKVYVKRPASKSPIKKKKRGKMEPNEANPTKLSIPVDEES
ncbi:hypothetical protein MRB53_010988 [Persea americana]|uniref:Uncharacterized protein n=1 Tax=Persea americana TaxID=3435 RepID=A0ACC2LTM0_PERAE|nr:hypothetical protein MRB53_010988 [Persea americana]